MRAKDVLGRRGEELAADHLRRSGLVILDRNWRCAEGELDIVARDGRTLVFCEVKTRSGTRFGSPAEAVVAAKARRIRHLAARWLAAAGAGQAARPTTSSSGGIATGGIGGIAGTGGRDDTGPTGAAGPLSGPREIRFDVVSIVQRPGGRPVIDHLRGAF